MVAQEHNINLDYFQVISSDTICYIFDSNTQKTVSITFDISLKGFAEIIAAEMNRVASEYFVQGWEEAQVWDGTHS